MRSMLFSILCPLDAGDEIGLGILLKLINASLTGVRTFDKLGLGILLQKLSKNLVFEVKLSISDLRGSVFISFAPVLTCSGLWQLLLLFSLQVFPAVKSVSF